MTILSIPEMSCGLCKATIEKTITALDPAALLDFDMPARTLNVQTGLTPEAMRTALSAIGYAATVA